MVGLAPLSYPRQPGLQKILDVASRKGVALDIWRMPWPTRTAEEAAAAVEADLGQIVRTDVVVSPRPEGWLVPIICLVSGRNKIDLSVVAAVTGQVAARPATAQEAHDLTGYSAGGIPPFGHGRDVAVVMDQDLCRYQSVWAAAGTDSAVFQVAPRTLRMLSNAVVARLS